jgi:drug/metabolite transporter (DMT)-like permease
VVTVLAAAGLLGESITALNLAGGACIVAALVLLSLPSRSAP